MEWIEEKYKKVNTLSDYQNQKKAPKNNRHRHYTNSTKMTICPLLLKNQQLWTEITEHRINENRIYKVEWIDKDSVYTKQFVSHSKVKYSKRYDRSN
jgi:hypothetical protein